jgi:hypothetical protein
MRFVVNVTAGGRYGPMGDRLESILKRQGQEYRIWRELPKDCPPHGEVPYAFKLFAIRSALERYGEPVVLWADSSIVPIRSLEFLWDLIERQGYWFSENLPYGKQDGPSYTCGQWACDAALPLLGITRETALEIPQVIATAFGLDFRTATARSFFEAWWRLMPAFKGAWWDPRSPVYEGSKDSRVLGHGHDQSAASVVAWRAGFRLTRPPAWIVDGIPATSETVLEIHRI